MKTFGRPVFLAGAGKTPFGAFPDKDLRNLAQEAGRKALHDAGLGPDAVEAFYLGNFAGPEFTGQNHLAPYISEALGIAGVPATRIEAACASGGAALVQGWMAVATGLCDTVMVLGVEKMTCQPTARVTEILAGAGDCAGEVKAGSTFPALFAMIARRHMHDFGTTREHLSAVAVKNHANGALNPDAQMRKVITLEQAMNARPIAEPINLYDCSLISDGAAAILLSSSPGQVRVRGIGQTSDSVALDLKPDITTFPAVREAARTAFQMAGLGPKDIQFAELHDCFTIAEVVALEDLGFAERGQGGPFSAEGCTSRDGTIPVNLSGGLKSKGHPVGATGVAQICDLMKEFRSGGQRSVGLAQNLGGSGATCVVTICERV